MAAQATASPVTRNEMRPVKYHYADTFWCTYAISVVSANIAELGVYNSLSTCIHFTQCLKY